MESTVKLDIPIFGATIDVYVGHNFEELMRHFRKCEYMIENSDMEYDGEKGLYMNLYHPKAETQSRVIWLKKFDGGIEDLGTLTHECTHASQGILEDCGVPNDWVGTESVAYLQEWIFKEILKQMGYTKIVKK